MLINRQQAVFLVVLVLAALAAGDDLADNFDVEALALCLGVDLLVVDLLLGDLFLDALDFLD